MGEAMVNRLLWMLLVIVLAGFAAVLGAFLRRMLMPLKKTSKKRRRELTYDDYDEEGWTTRNAPKNPMTVWILAAVGGAILLSICTCSSVMLILQSLDKQNPGIAKDGAPPPPPPPPPKPANFIDPIPKDLGHKEKQTEILGGAFDPTFQDEAPPGGWLIGFEVGLRDFLGADMVGAIQPIYRMPQGEVTGRKYGTDFSKRVTVKAKAGYAVGAINVKAGLIVNGFAATFMRVKGARLDPGDAYSSPWIGDKIGGNGPTLLAGDGTPIVGVIGKRNASDCNGIGLLKK